MSDGQTSKWQSKRIWHNLILFGVFLAVKLMGVDIDDSTKNTIITNFDMIFNSFILLWNIIIKIVDDSSQRVGEMNLSFWNLFGIFRELFRVIGAIRG